MADKEKFSICPSAVWSEKLFEEDVDSPPVPKKRKITHKTPSKRVRKKVQINETEHVIPEACVNAETVDDVLEDMEEEIDNALEQPCYKDKLTPTNVKSILRHIIANEYVLTMVQNTMNPGEDGEMSDLKLTRSKAKEVRKQQCSLPWPVASPAKSVQKVSKKLLEEEFPDESSGDEDYKPEDELHSEDERASSVGTPRSFRASVPSSPVSKTTDAISEDENALVIAVPDLEVPPNSSEADKIALRTRSKLCLNDTPLEEIEASFVAPDFTVDMYNDYCDDEDWNNFLVGLKIPNDSTTAHDHHDDAENDPEYKATEEEVPDYEDLCYEPVTNDELTDMYVELLEKELCFLDEDEEEAVNVESLEIIASPVNIDLHKMCEEQRPAIWMTSDERLQLQEQMRMYVQLLTQSHLMSHGNPPLKNLYDTTKIFLEELKHLATLSGRDSSNPSAFYAHNLDGALEIVKKFEAVNLPTSITVPKQIIRKFAIIAPHIKQTLAKSKVFIYPELLPTHGFSSVVEYAKHFITPEDNLVALGLEMFQGYKDPIECINKYLVPTKSCKKIRTRLKNISQHKVPITNSIRYFQKFKHAPKFQKVIRIFDPDHIKAPEDYTSDLLPAWMESFSKHPVPKPEPPKPPPEPPKPRKYVPILPRFLYVPPAQPAEPVPVPQKKTPKKTPRKSKAPSICDSETPYIPPPETRKPRKTKKKKDSKQRKKCPESDSEIEEISVARKKLSMPVLSVRRSERIRSKRVSVVRTRVLNTGKGSVSVVDLCSDSEGNTDDNDEGDCEDNSDIDKDYEVNGDEVASDDSVNADDEENSDNEVSNGGEQASSEEDDSNVNNMQIKDSNEDKSKDEVNDNDDDNSKIEVNNHKYSKVICDEVQRDNIEEDEEDSDTNDEDSDNEEDSDNDDDEDSGDEDNANCEAECGGWLVEEDSLLSPPSVLQKESSEEKNKPSPPEKQTRNKPRDLESSLALLQSETKKVPEKENEVMCANIYLLRATEMLKEDPDVYQKFLATLCKYHHSMKSPVGLYSELQVILKDYPTLVNDFVVFLRPEQAKKCERYKEHVELSKVREFFRKVELHFKDQPEHMRKILRTFAQLQKQVNLTSSEAISALRPLLNNQTHLVEELNNLKFSS